MKKLHLILLITVAFVAGGTVGGYATNRLQTNPTTSINNSQSSTDTVSQEKRSGDDESGFDMTSTEMINELQSLPAGSTFDRKYINYTIASRNNEIGMARQALIKSTHPEIKQTAQEQIDQSDKLVNTMYGWIKLWGFTDH